MGLVALGIAGGALTIVDPCLGSGLAIADAKLRGKAQVNTYIDLR